MKFGSSVADISIIKHTEFVYDAFGLDNSTVHCLGVQFFRGHSVYIVASIMIFSVLLSKFFSSIFQQNTLIIYNFIHRKVANNSRKVQQWKIRQLARDFSRLWSLK